MFDLIVRPTTKAVRFFPGLTATRYGSEHRIVDAMAWAGSIAQQAVEDACCIVDSVQIVHVETGQTVAWVRVSTLDQIELDS